jgi:hypothetical protein
VESRPKDRVKTVVTHFNENPNTLAVFTLEYWN